MATKRFGSQTSRVYETIREMILNGQVPPGARIGIREMAAKLGSSNGPIRDSLLQLSNEKLVKGGSGLEWSVSVPSREMIEKCMVVREALECQSARLCAQNATEADIENLRRLAQQVEISAERGLSRDSLTIELDGRLHMQIAELSDSEQLCEEIERWKIVMDWAQMYMETHNMFAGRQPGESHLELVKAIATGDKDFAERQMRRHVRYPWDNVTWLDDVADLKERNKGKAKESRMTRDIRTKNKTSKDNETIVK